MTEFKIGDRVKTLWYGAEGVIVNYDDKFWDVVFEDHPGRNGGYFTSSLELIEEKQVTKFKAMKFRIESPEHSERVQKILFHMGYNWAYGSAYYQHMDSKYLFTDADSHITYGLVSDTFDKSGSQEIDVSWLVPAEETVEVLGKTYKKRELEERLASLDAVGG